MTLYENWKNKIKDDSDKVTYTEFVQKYYSLEEAAYKKIFEAYPIKISGKFSELSNTFGFGDEHVIFTGFLDGINESIEKPLDLETLDVDSEISLNINYEKLFWNMHEAKADWLYNLSEWDNVIPLQERNEIAKKFRTSKIVHSEKIGRNDPCTCGSGKKYKNCCLNK